MEVDHNDDRIVYVRFNMHVVYIEPMRKNTDTTTSEKLTRYAQGNTTDNRMLRLDSQVDSVEFFEDPEKQRLIYRFQP